MQHRVSFAVFTALAAFSAPAVAAAVTGDEIAHRRAPIHYQDTDASSPREDFLAAFDYDGNFDGTDNWDHLDRSEFPPLAVVYYAVAETCTHWFISYGFFHPRDWSDDGVLIDGSAYDRYGYLVDEGQEHENDLEDALMVVRKADGPFGRVDAVLTQAHGGYHSWVPSWSTLTAASGHRIHGPLFASEYPEGSGDLRPLTAQHAKGHGLGAIGAFSDFAGEPDRDGIVYYPTGVSELPSSGNDREVGYALVPLLAPGGLFDRQLSEDLLPSTRVAYVTWATFRGDQTGSCGAQIDITCVSNAAKPPWGQDDASEPAPRGAPVLDPADMARYYFVGFDDYDLDYLENGFIASLRDHGYGPQPDGSVRKPDGYNGPDLPTLFDKLLGSDGDLDGVHTCKERDDGTDPRLKDSDGDGADDGVDKLPLDPTETLDTDADGIGNNADTDDDGDGVADAVDAFPLDPHESVDADGDGVGDNADVDDDNDGLSDAIETAYGTDPHRADSDGDGLKDGRDVEFVQNALRTLPLSAFKSPGTSNLGAFLARLDEIERLLLSGKESVAIKKLLDLRLRVNGCGVRSDSDDWLRDCDAQLFVRSLLDVLIANVRS